METCGRPSGKVGRPCHNLCRCPHNSGKLFPNSSLMSEVRQKVTTDHTENTDKRSRTLRAELEILIIMHLRPWVLGMDKRHPPLISKAWAPLPTANIARICRHRHSRRQVEA